MKDFPAVHVPAEHQSAPKEHPADAEIRKAAEEIASGNFVPEAPSEEARAAAGMGLALGLGADGVATGAKPALEEFRATYDENRMMEQLGQHPRVIEALEKMKHEVAEAKGHELQERNAMLRELTMAAEKKNRWDGQGRWMGEENEEMRYGEILSPQQFYDRLGKVTGKGRLKLSEHVMFPHQGARSGLGGIYMRNPLWDHGAEMYREGQRAEALKMADAAQAMWADAQRLQRLGKSDLAEKKIKEVSALVAEAKGMHDQAATDSYNAEPEFVRVATMQWPLSTEWMIVQFTEWGNVAKPKFYGWRTALLTMIRCGAITEAQAHKAFPVGSGPAGEWYLQQIYEMKSDGGVQ